MRPGPRIALMAATIAAAITLLAPGAAHAGSFVIETCGTTGSSAGWMLSNGYNSYLAGGTECPPDDSTGWGGGDGVANNFHSGLWVGDRLVNDGGSPSGVPGGAHAELTFSPAAGTTITRFRYWRFVGKDSDDNWHPYIALDDGTVVDTCELGGFTQCWVGSGWVPSSGTSSSSYRDVQGLSTAGLTVGVTCRATSMVVCDNGFSLAQVDAHISRSLITVSDPSTPTVQAPTGAGWTTSAWSSATLPLTVASSDNTGIASTSVYIDSTLAATVSRSCAYTQPVPCTNEPGAAVGIPTSGADDGLHTVQVQVMDAAGNTTSLVRPAQLAIDNAAPAAPTSVEATSGATRDVNTFDITWQLPADAGSPITQARYRLCDAGGSSCGAIQTAPSLTSITSLTLPAVRTSLLRVWLVDELGHEDPGRAATLALAYQPPTPPGGGGGGSPGPTPTPMPNGSIVKTDPKLRIKRLARSGRRVRLSGTTSTKASGRLTITYAARVRGRTRRLTRHATLRHGRYSVAFTLTSALSRPSTGKVSVRYAGDRDTRTATRMATVRLAT
jgi:hypothetical protein